MHGVVGFSPGVFDLFHVGHLDVLRRADAECGWLVVGVLTDELAETLCGARPIVPLIERMEIVGHCRHVGRVVALQELDLPRTRAEVGYDVLFTGRPDVVVPAGAEHELACAGVRVVRFADAVETRSPVLRAALAGAEPRSSVA